MSATRDGERGRALRLRLVLPDGERQEVDRLEVVLDGVASRHVRDDPTVARFASVVPLVSARALAHPFTYLADGLEKGAVVSVRFGRASRRGVVVGLEDEAPPEVDPVAVEGVLGAVPAPLVDLALWVAEYYGSTPARALALVAPAARSAAPGRGDGPARRTCRPKRRPRAEPAAGGRAGEDRRRAGRGRRDVPAPRRDGQRQDRGLPAGLRGGARARARGDRARARDRAHAADASAASARASRTRRRAPLRTHGGRAPRRGERIAAGEAGSWSARARPSSPRCPRSG